MEKSFGFFHIVRGFYGARPEGDFLNARDKVAAASEFIRIACNHTNRNSIGIAGVGKLCFLTKVRGID